MAVTFPSLRFGAASCFAASLASADRTARRMYSPRKTPFFSSVSPTESIAYPAGAFQRNCRWSWPGMRLVLRGFGSIGWPNAATSLPLRSAQRALNALSSWIALRICSASGPLAPDCTTSPREKSTSSSCASGPPSGLNATCAS